MATLSDTTTKTGTVLPPEEVADYQELRALFSPSQSLILLDNFAKWLFGLSGTVGVIGTGFGISKASDLHGTGQTLFAWAVACVAGSLALAAFARLPLPLRVNRFDSTDMRKKLQRLYVFRAGLLALSTCLFAAALILAGLVPLESG
jgi:hypothetical protein